MLSLVRELNYSVSSNKNCKKLKIIEFVGDFDPNSIDLSSFKKNVILMFQANSKKSEKQ